MLTHQSATLQRPWQSLHSLSALLLLFTVAIHYVAGNNDCQCVETGWRSAVCTALESINADLEGKTYDSPQAVPIGTVACSIMCLVLAAVVLLDSGKLYADFTMMKSNIRRLMGKRTNKVEPNPWTLTSRSRPPLTPLICNILYLLHQSSTPYSYIHRVQKK